MRSAPTGFASGPFLLVELVKYKKLTGFVGEEGATSPLFPLPKAQNQSERTHRKPTTASQKSGLLSPRLAERTP
jgi:hypothetical protein